MSRAMLVKLAAGVLIGLEAWLLSGSAAWIAISATVAATVAFFAWVITSPRSQFFVPSVSRLPETRSRGEIAFTFDDGPDPVITPRVLDLLSKHDARATFFIVGKRAAQHPDLVRRIVAEGHLVGSHSYEHSHVFHLMPPTRIRADVERGIEAIAAVTGSRPRLFRPPQGLRTPLLADALEPLRDLVCVTWTERGLDTIGRAASAIVRRLEPRVRPSAILTLHDGRGFGGSSNREPTVEALDRLLAVAESRDLRCVSLAALEAQAEGAPRPAS